MESDGIVVEIASNRDAGRLSNVTLRLETRTDKARDVSPSSNQVPCGMSRGFEK
jgi:hypothetical protein